MQPSLSKILRMYLCSLSNGMLPERMTLIFIVESRVTLHFVNALMRPPSPSQRATCGRGYKRIKQKTAKINLWLNHVIKDPQVEVFPSMNYTNYCPVPCQMKLLSRLCCRLIGWLESFLKNLSVAAARSFQRNFIKQTSLSDSLEKETVVPLRATLKMKSQRLRQWDLDIHFSSNEDLVGSSCPASEPCTMMSRDCFS